MKTTSESHDRAQRKAWLAERKTIAAAIRKMKAATRKELGQIIREMKALEKRRIRINRSLTREETTALRRLAILNGRLGL